MIVPLRRPLNGIGSTGLAVPGRLEFPTFGLGRRMSYLIRMRDSGNLLRFCSGIGVIANINDLEP